MQLYVLRPLSLWRLEHPRVSLNMFIDDLLGQCIEKAAHLVVGYLTQAAASLRSAIESELRCKVADHKSALLASDDKLLTKLVEAFGRFAGQGPQVCGQLGDRLLSGSQAGQQAQCPCFEVTHGQVEEALFQTS